MSLVVSERMLSKKRKSTKKGVRNYMSAFIETVRQGQKYELCGRIIRIEGDLVIFIDGIGKFVLAFGMVTATLAGLGESHLSGPAFGVARLSESGRGFYLDIENDTYVIPVSRVRAVMSGEHRKGPISRVC